MRNLRRLAVALVVAAVALAAVTAAVAKEGDDKVTFTVGFSGDYDTLNPLVGVEVPDFEVWNLNYAGLTTLAAADFAVEPALAESWEASNDGKTYTYTLRDGLEWSDGTPLTAEDIAYTVNRGRDEEWLNYSSVVQNLTAKAIDARTVEITSKVPDPKLPGLGVYVLPKHVWEKFDAKAVTKVDGTEGVGSGPFILVDAKRGQFMRLEANDAYWAGRPEVDEVVIRLFTNADAMVAALEKGELDAIHDVPVEAFERLQNTEGIVALSGEQGGFNEISVNGARPDDKRVEGIGNGHPALSDIEVRKAIAHAIDKETLIERVNAGIGRPGVTISPSANPMWKPEIPEDEQFLFDLAKANEILDAAGYEDTNGDGIREMPGGGDDIVLDYVVRSESQSAPGDAEFVSGWLEEIGIGTKLRTVNDATLTTIIGKGDYDLFEWGWTPYVDPDTMLWYFTCENLSVDPENPTNYWNDANWCDPSFDADYKAQNQELDPDKRLEIVHRMLRTMYASAAYNVIVYEGDLQAYRTDRFEGWLRQPADTGPVLFSNTSPTYANLSVGGSGDSGDGGVGTAGYVVLGIAAGVALLLAVYLLGRRRSVDERE